MRRKSPKRMARVTPSPVSAGAMDRTRAYGQSLRNRRMGDAYTASLQARNGIQAMTNAKVPYVIQADPRVGFKMLPQNSQALQQSLTGLRGMRGLRGRRRLGDVTLPGGVTFNDDGTITAPDGTTVYPGASGDNPIASTASGGYVFSDGSYILPDGTYVAAPNPYGLPGGYPGPTPGGINGNAQNPPPPPPPSTWQQVVNWIKANPVTSFGIAALGGIALAQKK